MTYRYHEILDAILDQASRLTIDDLEDVITELTALYDQMIEDMPYEPDHFDDHRREELRRMKG